MTGLSRSKYLKKDSYDLMLGIVDRLTKIFNYKLVKTTIDAAWLAEVIINMLIKYNDFLNYIISNKDALYILKV